MIVHDSLAGREVLWKRLQSDDEDVALAAREEHAQVIAKRSAALGEEAAALGATVLGAAKYAPFVFAEGPVEAVAAVADMPSVHKLLDDPGGPAEEHSQSPPAAVHAVSAFGPTTTGTARKVGMIEPGTCRIRNTHVLVDAPTPRRPATT